MTTIQRSTANCEIGVAQRRPTTKGVPPVTMLGPLTAKASKRCTTDSFASVYNENIAMHALGPKLLRVRGFSSNTLQRRARYEGTVVPSVLFSPSEAHILENARYDIMSRRRYSGEDHRQVRHIFWAIVLLTFVCPLVGFLAIFGAFDSTISWYTRGGRYSLTQRQRTWLKKQLAIEAVICLIAVIVMSVYFGLNQ